MGRFYRPSADGGALGFEVREPFLTPFLELGGPAVAGYPASAPFLEADGCLYQAFQVLLLQACPGAPLRLANTFEIMEAAGADGALLGLGVGSAEQDSAGSFLEAVGARLSWLQDAPIRDRYLQQCGDGDPRRRRRALRAADESPPDVRPLHLAALPARRLPALAGRRPGRDPRRGRDPRPGG